MKKSSPSSDLERFLLGLIMLIGGLYWLISKVRVTTGIWGFGYGSYMSGMIVIPFVIGIVWLIINHRSVIGKIITVIGAIALIFSIIASTRLYMVGTSLFTFILMLILIFGGAVMLLSVLLVRHDDKDHKD